VRGVRTEHLYLVLALGALGFLVSIAPILPHDLWWHLRVGQLIAQDGRVPQGNLFAWSIPPDTPYTYAVWLGEWLLYTVHRLGEWSRVGGWELLIFVRNALVLGTYTLLAVEVRRRTGSIRLAALAVGLAGTMALNNLDLRPQMWSWLLFVLTLVLLRRYVDGALRARWLALLPAILVVWVNSHGSFTLGIALASLVALGETLRRLMRFPGALIWPRIALIYVVVAADALATLLNPHGLGVWVYVRLLLTDPATRLLADWQPPTPGGVTSDLFFVSILLLVVALAYARGRPSPTDLLLVCAFMWLAWSGQRYIIWFGLVAMPVLAEALARTGLAMPRPTPSHRGGALNTIIGTLIVVPVVLAQPWLVRNLPEPYLARMLEPPAPPLLTLDTPVGAAEFLRGAPGGRLFNEMGYGSYLIWALPDQSVFVDPRVELFPPQIWEDYFSISRGQGADGLLRRYGIDRVLLSREAQPDLAAALAMTPSWQREYVDGWSEVWRRVD
jgi:hypothetical protein